MYFALVLAKQFNYSGGIENLCQISIRETEIELACSNMKGKQVLLESI